MKAFLVWTVLVVASAALAASPPQKCEAGKKKVAAKYSSCRAKADARLVFSGDLKAHGAALATCKTKFMNKMADLEFAVASIGLDCPTMLDRWSLEEYVATCSDAVNAATMAGGRLPSCGDGNIDSGEDCDFGSLDGASCETQGFDGGELQCGPGCRFDTSGCWSGRFHDGGDGSIFDRQTGLSWEKKRKLGGGANPEDLHDADNLYLWAGQCQSSGLACQPDEIAAAACAAGVEGDASGCAVCGVGDDCDTLGYLTIWQWLIALNSESFGGHSDWRVPKLSELESILDRDHPSSPVVDAAFHAPGCAVSCADLNDPQCSCTPSYFYWTSSTQAASVGKAWIVSFSAGTTGTNTKVYGDYVRAVRGGM